MTNPTPDMLAAMADPETLAEVLANVHAIDPDRFEAALAAAGIFDAFAPADSVEDFDGFEIFDIDTRAEGGL